MRRFAIAVVIGAVLVAGCSSSGSKAASTTTTGPGSTTTRAGSTTTGAPTTKPAPVTPTTAPTHAITVAAPSVSASFVSPRQGFALERNGRIDTTTDGGQTWHPGGNLGRSGEDEIIRFIDPSDGFAFQRLNGGLFITHDAGASWIKLTTPFSNVADLAILRGTVYVVALHTGNSVNFQIWSTPVEHLVWKQDPLTLAVGAGPVPSVQIVLAGNTGWIVNSNRTVIAGARLGTNRRWTSWTPPCKAFGGDAGLAASTSTDLVAVCSPGPATPASLAMTSRIELSHDGGTTFTSKTIPDAKFGAGGPLSPTADTAVIIDAGDFRRTTNGGTTWQVVATATGSSGGADFGFTTSTQGFIILANGNMLMTHDAGATWKQVTLP
jgi:photosystem II stability/assembly factor-like uncharacterized protein